MKVITIKQPFASLIACGLKKYEFRSWKTNYRGELYIHAGKSCDNDSMSVISKYNLECLKGYIIAKVNLTDCILVDKNMNEKLNAINSDVYRHNYTGCYAWKFENVEILKNPIKINGKLGIWNYNNTK